MWYSSTEIKCAAYQSVRTILTGLCNCACHIRTSVFCVLTEPETQPLKIPQVPSNGRPPDGQTMRILRLHRYNSKTNCTTSILFESMIKNICESYREEMPCIITSGVPHRNKGLRINGINNSFVPGRCRNTIIDYSQDNMNRLLLVNNRNNQVRAIGIFSVAFLLFL